MKIGADHVPLLGSPQLLRSSEGPVLRRRRHLDPAKPYIAAKLTSLPATFTLGDEKMYNGFYNKPLSSQQEYLCFVLAVLRYEETNNTANYVRRFLSPQEVPPQLQNLLSCCSGF